jgi:hypothetical protein
MLLNYDDAAMDAGDLVCPRTVLDLAVLGVTSTRALTAAEVIAVVKRIGGTRFQPTTEVIGGRIAALAAAGLLLRARGDGAGEVRWQPTAAGRAHVQRLLMALGGSPVSALAAVCACLRICFLELLEGDARGAVLADLIAGHRRALDLAEAALADCSCRCAYVQRCLAREVERWQAEVCWLETLVPGVQPARWQR